MYGSVHEKRPVVFRFARPHFFRVKRIAIRKARHLFVVTMPSAHSPSPPLHSYQPTASGCRPFRET
jgi:hypothetical protein